MILPLQHASISVDQTGCTTSLFQNSVFSEALQGGCDGCTNVNGVCNPVDRLELSWGGLTKHHREIVVEPHDSCFSICIQPQGDFVRQIRLKCQQYEHEPYFVCFYYV